MSASDGSPSRGRSSVANAKGLEDLGAKMPSGSKRRRRPQRSRRRTWLRRGVISVVVVIVLVIGAVIGDYYYLGSLVHHKEVHGLQTSGTTENILLIGSTTRCGLKKQNAAYGTCAEGVTGVNSDIDMILHLNPATGKVSLLSIPRDLFVPNARGINGDNKIDAALYLGPSQLVATIEEDFGIAINHYVELNFDTFASVVDALGGVRMYFPIPVWDAESGLWVKHPGCYLLNGYRALQVVRARHLQIQPSPGDHARNSWPQETQSDLARIRRTHEFLRVLAAEVASRGIGNPFTDQSIAQSVLPDLTVDQNFSESLMVHLASTFAHTSINNVLQLTYPVSLVETGTYLFQGYHYGDVEFPVEPDGLDAIDSVLGVSTSTNTFTNKPLPAPGSFTLAVEDGNGITHPGTNTVAALNRDGFSTKYYGNVKPVGVVGETVVWYGGPPPPTNGNWVSPNLAAAEEVLSQLQGPAILGYAPSNVRPGSLVTLKIGTGLTVTQPPSTVTTTTIHGVTTTTMKSSTTTTTPYDPPGIKKNGYFTAPTSTDPSLEPWDPRACNAAGTGPAPVTGNSKAK